jgi:hypothetical protein
LNGIQLYESDEQMLEQALSKLLNASKTVKISTASQWGAPWIATAFFVSDDVFALYVLLEGRGRTLTNLRANPCVAVMIENGDADALFAQGNGRATLLKERRDEICDAILAKTPESNSLVELPHLLPVKLEIDCWRLTDVSAGWVPARELMRPAATLEQPAATSG